MGKLERKLAKARRLAKHGKTRGERASALAAVDRLEARLARKEGRRGSGRVPWKPLQDAIFSGLIQAAEDAAGRERGRRSSGAKRSGGRGRRGRGGGKRTNPGDMIGDWS